MLSFNTISLFTTAALAAFASAAPLSVPPAADGAVGLAGPAVGEALGVAGPVVGEVLGAAGVAGPVVGVAGPVVGAATGVAGPLAGGVVPTIPRLRSEVRTLPVIIQDACTRITPVTDKINGIIAADVSVKVEVLVPLLGEIKEILGDIVAEVQYLVAHPIDGVLELAGEVLTIAGVAKLVAALLTLVVTVLVAVLKVVATADVYVIQPLVADIGSLLAALLAAVFAIVSGLLPVLLGLIGDLIPLLINLNIATVLQILGVAH